jgi:uncharacterized protein YuzE
MKELDITKLLPYIKEDSIKEDLANVDGVVERTEAYLYLQEKGSSVFNRCVVLETKEYGDVVLDINDDDKVIGIEIVSWIPHIPAPGIDF